MAKDQKAKKLKNTDPLLIINGSDQIRVRIFFAYFRSGTCGRRPKHEFCIFNLATIDYRR